MWFICSFKNHKLHLFSSFCTNSWSSDYRLISIHIFCYWGANAFDHYAAKEDDRGAEKSFIPYHLSINAPARPSVHINKQIQAGADVVASVINIR